MADKLSSRQRAQMALLDTLPAQFALVNRLIEEIAGPRPDETANRRLVRLLEKLKGATSAVSLSALTQTLGSMGMMARRTGGQQMKIRGLREGLGSLKVNFEGAVKEARRPAPEDPRPAEPPETP